VEDQCDEYGAWRKGSGHEAMKATECYEVGHIDLELGL